MTELTMTSLDAVAAGSAATGRGRVGFEVTDARRFFGPTKAVDGVDLRVERGTVNALMGANGSGKSTLVKMLAGVLPADGGTIDVGGGPVALASWTPALSHAAGFRFVHQDLGLFPSLTIADNLAMGIGYPTGPGGRIRHRQLVERAERVLTRLKVDLAPDRLVEDLSPGEQALVAIGRALQDSVASVAGVASVASGPTGATGESSEHEAAILVLDEPTAALGRDEATMLLEFLTGLAAAGETVLYIGHRLAEIFAIADRITVMRDGRVALNSRKVDTSRDAVINVMVSAEPGDAAAPAPQLPTPTHAPAASLLQCRGLRLGPLSSVDLDLPAGRVVGIAGLQGTGRTLLLRALFGDVRPEEGTILVDDHEVTMRSPRDAVARGIALVPGDRAREAIFPGLTIRENMLVTEWGRYRGRFVMNRSAQRQATGRGIRDLAIRAPGDHAGITDLSGGNQQKVVLARWLLRGSRVLLMDEPTQGVDVVARRDLWGIVRTMVDAGGGALVVSSDLEELLEVSDEVLVLRDGRISERFPRGTVDEEALNRACQGVHSEIG
jgi:ribose transport system ATP-binding protein